MNIYIINYEHHQEEEDEREREKKKRMRIEAISASSLNCFIRLVNSL